MTTKDVEKLIPKSSGLRKLCMLAVLFALILVCILVLRSFPEKESEFVDRVAGEIQQEMEDSRIVLSTQPLRRTVAEFREPIIVNHAEDSRLIVFTVHLSETVSVSTQGLLGMEWTTATQDVVFEGDAQYTVDLTQLSEDDFTVNNELKTLTVRIPYAKLEPINVPAEEIEFKDVVKGWAAPSTVKLTAEENAKVLVQATNTMKAKLIDDNVIAVANDSAKKVVAELLTVTVHSIDPEYTVVVVQ